MDSFKYYNPIFKVNDVIIVKEEATKSNSSLIFEVIEIKDNQYELKSFYLSSVHGKQITLTLPTMQVDRYRKLFEGNIENSKTLYF